jgi:hypothetical protein
MSPDRWTPSAPATRTVAEADVLDQLQLSCWPYETSVQPGLTRQRAADALEHLLRLGLPVIVRDGNRYFDPYEVANFMLWAHRALGDPLWSETFVVAERRFASEKAVGVDHRFEIVLEREVVCGKRPVGSAFRTQMPLPIVTEAQDSVVVELRGGPGVTITREGDCLDARARVPPDKAALCITATIAVRSGWQGHKVEPGRVEPFRDPNPNNIAFLSASEGIIQVTDPIRSLARELAGDTRTPWEALGQFWDFFYTRMTVGSVHYHALKGDDVLSDIVRLGRADCWYGSALLVALCRARGIPARLVGGYNVYSVLLAYHYWCEVLVEPYGWLPCDLWPSWVRSDGQRADTAWSDYFLGRIDPRLVVERFPRQHLLLSPSLPRAFYVQQRSLGRGTEHAFHDLVDGTMAYRDRLRLSHSTLAAWSP